LLSYHIFDIIETNMPFTQRLSKLKLIENLLNKKLKFFNITSLIRVVNTKLVDSNTQLLKAFNNAITNGHEGLMIRDPNAVYQYKRTNALLKFKDF